jgi:hypothetical protein
VSKVFILLCNLCLSSSLMRCFILNNSTFVHSSTLL